MRFLLDQDAVTASELGLSKYPDTGLLIKAAQQQRLFVTRDKDFGGLVFVERMGRGVIFLRILPETITATPD